MESEERREIVAVRRDEEGEISKVKFSSGEVLSLMEAIDLANRNELPGYHSQNSRLGKTFIASNRNLDKTDNLQSLPEF